MTPESSTQSHEVERFGAVRMPPPDFVGKFAADPIECVAASDFDALALRHREEVAAERRLSFALNDKISELEAEAEALRAMLRKLACQPYAPHDHMTACDRTMGDSHPCTCHANEARALLNATKGE